MWQKKVKEDSNVAEIQLERAGRKLSEGQGQELSCRFEDAEAEPRRGRICPHLSQQTDFGAHPGGLALRWTQRRQCYGAERRVFLSVWRAQATGTVSRHPL